MAALYVFVWLIAVVVSLISLPVAAGIAGVASLLVIRYELLSVVQFAANIKAPRLRRRELVLDDAHQSGTAPA